MMHRASSADCVIGVDLGTQGVRGVAVASNGTLVARASVPLPPETLATDPDGAFEQDAEEWWHATCIMLSRRGEQFAEAGVAPDVMRVLCIAGTSGTFVPLTPLTVRCGQCSCTVTIVLWLKHTTATASCPLLQRSWAIASMHRLLSQSCSGCTNMSQQSGRTPP